MVVCWCIEDNKKMACIGCGKQNKIWHYEEKKFVYIHQNTIIYGDQSPRILPRDLIYQIFKTVIFLNYTVNHTIEFVNIDNGMNNNTIEGFLVFKNRSQKKRGMKYEGKLNYLDFKMWLSRLDSNSNFAIFNYFLKCSI